MVPLKLVREPPPRVCPHQSGCRSPTHPSRCPVGSVSLETQVPVAGVSMWEHCFRLHLRSQPGQGDWQRQQRKLGCGAREGAMGVGCPPRHQPMSERRLFPVLRQPGRGRRRAGGWCSAPIPPHSGPGMSPPLQFPMLLKTGPKMGFSF